MFPTGSAFRKPSIRSPFILTSIFLSFTLTATITANEFMSKRKSDKEKTYSISELASQLEISPRTIRFYEEKGLISPNRTPGNQRIYTRKDRVRLKLILRGKRFGFSLDEIAEMIGISEADMNEVDQIEKSLRYGEKKLGEIRRHREELDLLEQDLLETRDKLSRRLKTLKQEEK